MAAKEPVPARSGASGTRPPLPPLTRQGCCSGEGTTPLRFSRCAGTSVLCYVVSRSSSQSCHFLPPCGFCEVMAVLPLSLIPARRLFYTGARSSRLSHGGAISGAAPSQR
ncbi:hypothetical protein GDO81_029332 [Engystomops pustulosus]|uniref:Uncharacterized protein n=1 Tax=Engystomops pustulosus TaxID=76066 RepID=A0AAV6YKA1_ENGPU|nr:hypothetical protein GDO81_029332 [Engystomops pustulosus]